MTVEDAVEREKQLDATLEYLLDTDEDFQRAVQLVVAAGHLHVERYKLGHTYGDPMEVRPVSKELRDMLMWLASRYSQALRDTLAPRNGRTMDEMLALETAVREARRRLLYVTWQMLIEIGVDKFIEWDRVPEGTTIAGFKTGDYEEEMARFREEAQERQTAELAAQLEVAMAAMPEEERRAGANV